MVEIDTLFHNKTGKKKNIPFGAAHTYIAYIRENPPPPAVAENALQIMSLAAYAIETNKGIEMYNKVCCTCKVLVAVPV